MAKSEKFHYWLTDDGLLLLEGWARDGLTDAQIAENMGVHPMTLSKWKQKYDLINSALKKNKEIADREVENALKKSAEGYDVFEEVWERQFNTKTGDFEMVLTKKTKKHIAPSNTAQIFWLKNRRPQYWRDKVESHLNANVSTNTKTIAELITSPVTTRDLAELIKEAKDDEGDK